MVGQAFGLYTHQRNNRIRSALLIAALFVLAYLATFGLFLVAYGFAGGPAEVDPAGDAMAGFVAALPVVTIATGLWIFIGFRINVWLIGLIAGAQPVTREENPKLHRMLEALCISRGLPVPKLAVIRSDALNAFASGANDRQFTVTVTTGLLDGLTDEEIEAVLAHELTHIRNGDVRLMVVAVVIAGAISLVGELIFRGMGRVRLSSDNDRKSGGAIIAILVGVAIIIVAWLLAVVVRLSLSRTREYLADAGAVELTKNPDAMISALLKIAGRADIEGVPSGVMDMCFENDPDDIADLFSTHPSIAKRIQALVETAGGRMPEMPPRPPEVGQRPDLPSMLAEAARRPSGAAAPP